MTASQVDGVDGLFGLFPAHTSASTLAVARKLHVPASFVSVAGDEASVTSNARQLTEAWGGPAVLRSAPKVSTVGVLGRFQCARHAGTGQSPTKTLRSSRGRSSPAGRWEPSATKRTTAISPATATLAGDGFRDR